MNKPAVFFLSALLFANLPAHGQDSLYRETDPRTITEGFTPAPNADLDYDELFDALFQYYREPLDLNRATAEDLRRFPFLTEQQIANLLTYRQETGGFLAPEELQVIEGFDLATAKKLFPYVIVRERGIKLLSPSVHYTLLRSDYQLEEAEGFKDGQYAGPRPGWLFRYRNAKTREYSFNLTLQHDPGEAYEWHPGSRSFGADFASFHAALFDKGDWEAVLVGDYELQFGQGLVVGGGFALGKGAEITAVRRGDWGILPYGSQAESGFFRGAAATYRYRRWSITAFASYVKKAATLNVDTTEQRSFASAIRLSGLHRTDSEREGKASLAETATGANVNYSLGNWTVGANVVSTFYDRPVVRDRFLYQQDDFQGDRNLVGGLHVSGRVENLNLFAEAAQSRSGGRGLVGGMVASLSKTLEWAMHLRHYDRDFHSLHGQAFAEQSRPQNETGVYNALRWRFAKGWQATAFYDWFRFDAPRYRADAPDAGHEWFLRLDYELNETTFFYGQARYQTAGRNYRAEDDQLNRLLDYEHWRWLLAADFSANERLSFRTRLQGSLYRHAGEASEGVLLAQDVRYTLGRLRFDLRYAAFDTQSFDSRLYVYERDVRYALSFPFYDGQGARFYAIARYKLNDWTIEAKYSISAYRNRENLFSGAQEVQGAQVQTLRGQILYNF